MSPKLPLALKSPKPKHFRYPKKVLTVGDEVRKIRIDRGLTQWNADDLIGAHRGFFNEIEMGNRENSIYVLYKAANFLGYVPKVLKIDETTPRGKMYAHRIINGYPLRVVAEKIGVDKSTLGRWEKGKESKKESIHKIQRYIRNHIDYTIRLNAKYDI